MGENTAIEWADHTFNPWIGCQKVSAACDFCYAEGLMDKRLGQVEWGPGKPRKRTSEANWRQPLKWNRKAAKNGIRQRVFCASLADVFDNAVPDEWREDLWHLIRETPSLTWMLLTKRPQNIARMLPDDAIRERVWLGTTAEHQEEADRRIPILLVERAAVRFVSMEPLLGPVDLTAVTVGGLPAGTLLTTDALNGEPNDYGYGLGTLDWVIAGGESGQAARPMHPDWARSIRDQCQAAGVPFFHKQNGEWNWIAEGNFADQTAIARSLGRRFEHHSNGQTAVRVGKKAAGRLLDGRTWDEVPA